MISPIYQHIAHEAMNSIIHDDIMDCAIGNKTVAIESDRGIGLAMRYPMQTKNKADEHRLEQTVCRMGLRSLIAAYLENDPLYAALGLAAINSLFIEKGTLPAPDYRQAFNTGRTDICLGLIGYFTPIVQFARTRGLSLRIFEQRALPDTFRPEEAEKELPACNIVIFTGSAFSNKSIHEYFSALSDQASAYILGPSTPMANCLARFHLGSSRVCNKNAVFHAIRHHASYQHIHPWLEKVGRLPHENRKST